VLRPVLQPVLRTRRVVSGVVVSTLVATSSLALVGSGSAGANPVSSLKAQARAISQKLVQEQLQIDAYQQQYSVATAKVSDDAQALAQIGQQLSQDEQQYDADTRQVRQLAITSYMNGGELTGSEASLFAGNAEEVQSATEYASIATGSIETALDQLQNAQDTLQSQQTALRQQQAKDQSDQTLQATSLSQANSSEQSLQSEQSLVTGQLAAAVAAQAAAQDASAAAAVAAAQKAGKTPGGKKPGPGSPTGVSSPPGSGVGPPIPDPALPPFLQCVVQAESRGNYGAVSPNGMYMGAFQFSQSTWNFAARAAGLLYLVGVAPNHATKPEQDTVAVALFALDGEQPWLGDRCSA
jgi:peptidoglycan hydrolase CwlO-like protein